MLDLEVHRMDLATYRQLTTAAYDRQAGLIDDQAYLEVVTPERVIGMLKEIGRWCEDDLK